MCTPIDLYIDHLTSCKVQIHDDAWLLEASIEVFDWFFWSHEMTVLESCPIPRWGTWPVDHCAPLSLSITSSLHWRCFMTDICPSFLRRSFCACLIKFVMELAFNFSVPFGNSMLAILFWWVHLYMLAVIKKSPRIRSNNYIGSCYTHSVVLVKKVILSF